MLANVISKSHVLAHMFKVCLNGGLIVPISKKIAQFGFGTEYRVGLWLMHQANRALVDAPSKQMDRTGLVDAQN